MYKPNFKTRNVEIITLIEEFSSKKLGKNDFELAKRLIQKIVHIDKTIFLSDSPEIWAAAIVTYIVNNKSVYTSKISISEINSYFGTNPLATEKKAKHIYDVLVSISITKRIPPGFIHLRHRQNIRLRAFAVRKAFSPDKNPSKTKTKNENDYIKYSVFYGTNRKAISDTTKLQFQNTRDNNLHLGICEISIPLTHKTGNVEHLRWYEKLIFEESPKNHFTILSNNQFKELDFKLLLEQKIGESDEKDVLLFIHGYNVKFDEAMKKAAQLGYDLAFKGCVSTFSWPSTGTYVGYISDMDSASLSSDYLCHFIKLLIGKNTKKLHIIAHSMGNIVLTQALLQLKEEKYLPNIVINQIILAAPDIDKDIFINQIMPKINGIARMTLYGSNKDNALLAAKKIRNNYERLGDGGENIAIVDGVESIDASNVDTNLLGHGYFAETQSLINDIHMVFLGLPPNKRILNKKNKLIEGVNKLYWAFQNT